MSSEAFLIINYSVQRQMLGPVPTFTIFLDNFQYPDQSLPHKQTQTHNTHTCTHANPQEYTRTQTHTLEYPPPPPTHTHTHTHHGLPYWSGPRHPIQLPQSVWRTYWMLVVHWGSNILTLISCQLCNTKNIFWGLLPYLPLISVIYLYHFYIGSL